MVCGERTRLHKHVDTHATRSMHASTPIHPDPIFRTESTRRGRVVSFDPACPCRWFVGKCVGDAWRAITSRSQQQQQQHSTRNAAISRPQYPVLSVSYQTISQPSPTHKGHREDSVKIQMQPTPARSTYYFWDWCFPPTRSILRKKRFVCSLSWGSISFGQPPS